MLGQVAEADTLKYDETIFSNDNYGISITCSDLLASNDDQLIDEIAEPPMAGLIHILQADEPQYCHWK